MKTTELLTQEPFSKIFPIQHNKLSKITADMRAEGYDQAFPIIVWKGRNTVVDGHTRLAAAIEAGVEDVPVYEMQFRDENEAYLYAVHCQVDRRNLTDAEIMRIVPEVDKRRKQGERTDLAPNGAKSGKSAANTAEVVGISTRKVERVRAVIDKATPEVKAAVEADKMKINKAYETTRKPKDVPALDSPLSEAEQVEFAKHEAVIADGLEVVTGTPKQKAKTLSQEIEHHIRETPALSMRMAWKAAKKSEREAFLQWVDKDRVKDLPRGEYRDARAIAMRLRRALKNLSPGIAKTVMSELDHTGEV